MRHAKSEFSSSGHLFLSDCILTLTNTSAQGDSVELTQTSWGGLEHSEDSGPVLSSDPDVRGSSEDRWLLDNMGTWCVWGGLASSDTEGGVEGESGGHSVLSRCLEGLPAGGSKQDF